MRFATGIAALAVVGLWAAVAQAGPTDGVLDACTPAEVAGAENETFKDMPPGSPGYREAELLLSAGITDGCQQSPRLFCPSCEISRGQLIVFLVRAAGLDLITPSTPTFSDVPASASIYPYVETAAAAGITQGCGGGMFCPNDPVPRAPAATLVMRAVPLDPVTPATPSFSDVPTTNPFYTGVETIRDACVTSGCGVDTYCPSRELLRAEAAVFIARAFDLDDINPCIDLGAGGSAGAAGAPAGGSGGTGAMGGSGASGGTAGSGAGAGWPDSGLGGGSAAGGAATGGSGTGPRGGAGDIDSGCGCRVAGAGGSPGGLLLFALALLGLRRRRSR